MFELTPQNALQYLQETGRLAGDEPARAVLLAGGVSNVVIRVNPENASPFVLKQSRPQLRTPHPWFSRIDRIYREVDVMRRFEPLVPKGVVPRILFEDRENFLFAMQAAPADHTVWKQALLRGELDFSIPHRLGSYLAAIHGKTRGDPDCQRELADCDIFYELRINPFYCRLAEVHPELAAPIGALIGETERNPLCAVHADFSPKNILCFTVDGMTQLMLVDFETGHYGEPAFDLGFFLSHLLLKTVLHSARFAEYAVLTTTFWDAYLAALEGSDSRAPAAFEAGPVEDRPADAAPLKPRPIDARPFEPGDLHRRTVPHLAACMWARIDGTSQVDYLPDPGQRQLVRDFCRGLLFDPPAKWDYVLSRLHSALAELGCVPPEPAAQLGHFSA